ncbi:cysteine hydrolase family protein (plasmid) [Streptomyces sp. BI20]|uniref:cysteine hydrolase family protein n=1 Tax=Streptomyces sp. BI20 TaxID=3403460 RepID=UPI003C745C17
MVRRLCPATLRVLTAAREHGLFVVHTRDGHAPDLADLTPAKRNRGRPGHGIGDPSPLGRMLVRGEPGHDIVPEPRPHPGEPVVDKPGKGGVHATALDLIPHGAGVRHLLITGVTTEVCVAARSAKPPTAATPA